MINLKNQKNVKNGKILEIPKNPKKFTCFHFFFHFFCRKKCYPLSFPILGGHDSTRALQSSPFRKYEKLKERKKWPTEKMPSSQFSNIRRTQFHQSSPVEPVSDFRGGLPKVHERVRIGPFKVSHAIYPHQISTVREFRGNIAIMQEKL